MREDVEPAPSHDGEHQQEEGERAQLVFGKAALDSAFQEELDSDEKCDREEKAVAVELEAVKLEDRWMHERSGSGFGPAR